jgi:hypothetical protein
LANLAQTRNRDLNSILEELKKNLAARGVRGIVGLARKFRIMDDDNSGLLSMSEFKKGMRETSLELSEQVAIEIDLLSDLKSFCCRIIGFSFLILIKTVMERLIMRS